MDDERKRSATRLDPSQYYFSRTLRSYSYSPHTGSSTKVTVPARQSVKPRQSRAPYSAVKLFINPLPIMNEGPDNVDPLIEFFATCSEGLQHRYHETINQIDCYIIDPNSPLNSHITMGLNQIKSLTRLGESLLRQRCFWIVLLSHLVHNEYTQTLPLVKNYDAYMRQTFKKEDCDDIWRKVNSYRPIFEVDEPLSGYKPNEQNSKNLTKKVHFATRIAYDSPEHQIQLKQWEKKTVKELEQVQLENLTYLNSSAQKQLVSARRPVQFSSVKKDQDFDNTDDQTYLRQNSLETMKSTIVSSLENVELNYPKTQYVDHNFKDEDDSQNNLKDVDRIMPTQIVDEFDNRSQQSITKQFNAVKQSITKIEDEGPQGGFQGPIVDEMFQTDLEHDRFEIVDDYKVQDEWNQEENIHPTGEIPNRIKDSTYIPAPPSTPIKDEYNTSPNIENENVDINDSSSLLDCNAIAESNGTFGQSVSRDKFPNNQDTNEYDIHTSEKKGRKSQRNEDSLTPKQAPPYVPDDIPDNISLDVNPPNSIQELVDPSMSFSNSPRLAFKNSEMLIQETVNSIFPRSDVNKVVERASIQTNRSIGTRNSDRSRGSLQAEQIFLQQKSAIPKKSVEENLGSGYEFKEKKGSQAIKQEYNVEMVMMPVRMSFRVKAKSDAVPIGCDYRKVIFVDNDGVRESFEPADRSVRQMDSRIQEGEISTSAFSFKKVKRSSFKAAPKRITVFNDSISTDYLGINIEISKVINPKFDAKGFYQLVEVEKSPSIFVQISENTAQLINVNQRIGLLQARPRTEADSDEFVRNGFLSYIELMKSEGTNILIMIFYGIGT